MSYARARRRALAWERYVQKTGTRSKHKWHRGHLNAFWQATNVGRYAPIGIRRDPWMLRHE
jgi:hypothetical protein